MDHYNLQFNLFPVHSVITLWRVRALAGPYNVTNDSELVGCLMRASYVISTNEITLTATDDSLLTASRASIIRPAYLKAVVCVCYVCGRLQHD